MEEGIYPARRAAWYAVAILTVCYTFSFVDRLILAFLVTPMKHDLHLSDTQIGLLQGVAFAALYSVLGIPFGLAADRLNRRNLIAAGVLIWSLMTSCGSLARTFWTLAFTRIGVGVGEATLSPAAFSMIADSFPRERLSSALSIYSIGVQVGAGLALILGGVVVQIVSHMAPVALPGLGWVAPWRMTFLVVGAPGIILVMLLATLSEPARHRLPGVGSRAHAGLANALSQLRVRWRSAIGISVLMGCQAMSNYAFGSWSPAFFERLHQWPKSLIGLTLGCLTIGCGCIGLVVGGRLSDRWLRSGMSEAPLRVGFVSLLGAICTLLPALMVQPAAVSVALLVPALFFLALPIGCLYASIQMIFTNEVRGTVSAIMLLVTNLGGVSLGSLLPGLLDDRFFHDEQMLGRSIAITVGGACLLGMLTAVLTYGPFRHDYTATRTGL
ncbi:MAG TPA: MFS transporter [Steroidobacteraceae bacterium]|nr:MFS transporter [Steroidobacteraceae bacterium]